LSKKRSQSVVGPKDSRYIFDIRQLILLDKRFSKMKADLDGDDLRLCNGLLSGKVNRLTKVDRENE